MIDRMSSVIQCCKRNLSTTNKIPPSVLKQGIFAWLSATAVVLRHTARLMSLPLRKLDRISMSGCRAGDIDVSHW